MNVKDMIRSTQQDAAQARLRATTEPSIRECSESPQARTQAPIGEDTVPFESLLNHRHSVRAFSDRPIDDGVVGQVAPAILDNHAEIFSTPSLLSIRFASRSWRNGPAVYDATDGVPLLVPTSNLTDSGSHSAWDENSGLSGAMGWMFVYSDLASATQRYGDMGLTESLVQAGAAVEVSWLSFLSLGLVCRPMVGLDSHFVRQFAPTKGPKARFLIALGFGHEA